MFECCFVIVYSHILSVFFLYIAFVYTIFIEIWLIHVHSRPHQCRPCLQLSFDSVNLFLFRSCSTLIQIDFKISSFRAIFKYFSIYISNYERRKKMVCVCINWINKLFSVIRRLKIHQNRRKKTTLDLSRWRNDWKWATVY